MSDDFKIKKLKKIFLQSWNNIVMKGPKIL